MRPNSASLTLTCDEGKRLNVLITECEVAVAHKPVAGVEPPPYSVFRAIWDTGATNTVITQAVVDKCGLKPTGMTISRGAHSEERCETYLVNVRLMGQVQVAEVPVTKVALPASDAQILIGMDIIALGDFAITCSKNRTVFSFRVPSEAHIDYVERHNEHKREQDKKNFRAGKKPFRR